MIRFLRWLTAPVEAATETTATPPTDQRIATEAHKCGPWCATWTIAELRSLADTAPHECGHYWRQRGRCARRWPLA